MWVLALVIGNNTVAELFQKLYYGGPGSPPNLSKMLCDEKEHFEKSPGTGIDEIVGIAGLPTIGLQNAMCNVSDIKKSSLYRSVSSLLFDQMPESVIPRGQY